MFKKYKLRNYDFGLLIMVLVITVIGILAIGSARASVQPRQIQGMVLGLILLVIISLIDYSFLLKFAWLGYAAMIISLLLVEFLGDEGGGAQRWFEIGGLRFQPSELAKILLILFYAHFIMKHRDQINSVKILLACVLLAIPPLGLVYAQPDLSTTIVIMIIFCVLMFVGGLSYKIILGVLAVIIPVGFIFLSLIMQPDQQIIQDYQRNRIMAWLDSEANADDAYQQENSKIAIGSGQLWGKGLNNNEIASVKNGNFIPEPQTDFIFAVIGEELGFVGAVAVILLLLMISLRCVMIARTAKDLAGTLIAAGMSALIGFQSFINISVATGLIPNTGIPLPFLSYGLTSLVTLYMGMGFVLNVSLQRKNLY